MMRAILPPSVVVIALLMAGIASAQNAPPPIDQAVIDQAMRRLDERQRAENSTTQPALTEIQALRREIANLRQNMQRLQNENTALRTRLSQAQQDRDDILKTVQSLRDAAERAERLTQSNYRSPVDIYVNGRGGYYPWWGPVSPLLIPNLPTGSAPTSFNPPPPGNTLNPFLVPGNSLVPAHTARNYNLPHTGGSTATGGR